MSVSDLVAELEDELEEANRLVAKLEKGTTAVDAETAWRAEEYEALCELLEDHRRGIVDIDEVYERAGVR